MKEGRTCDAPSCFLEAAVFHFDQSPEKKKEKKKGIKVKKSK